MELKIHKINNHIICEVKSDSKIINNLQDAIDILGNSHYLEANGIIIYQKQLSADFFDLKTLLAGEILQKFSNYQMKLAIIGEFNNIKSKSLNAFMYECNRTGHISFVKNIDDAMQVLVR